MNFFKPVCCTLTFWMIFNILTSSHLWPFAIHHSWAEETKEKQSTDHRTQSADQAYMQRESEAKARKALSIYRRLHTERERHPDYAWKTAMASYYVGLHHPKNEKEAEMLFEKGEEAAREGFLFNEDCAPCYFWAAVNNLLWGQKGGSLRLLFVIRTAQKNLEKVNQLDETVAYAGGWRTLGQIEVGLPGFFGGSDERAERYFKKAIEIVPEKPINYLYLTRLYLEQMDQPEKALEVANKAVRLPPPPEHDVENRHALRDLQKILKKKLSNVTLSKKENLPFSVQQ